MQLQTLKLQNFRNVEFAELDLDTPAHFFLGNNGQGKTNLLEAIGLLTALRSFRTTDNRTLIREGQTEAKLLFKLNTSNTDHEVLITLRRGGKEIHMDGEPIKLLSEFIGLFPTVALSADDIRLIRGQPGGRRRYVDMLLSASDPQYFKALQNYHKATKQRNALLKLHSSSDLEIASFERPMAEAAALLFNARMRGSENISNDLKEAYAAIADKQEDPDFTYRPDRPFDSANAFLEEWERERPRDRERQATRHGPHRDDYELRLLGRNASMYASEGQQRALTLSLMLAQIPILRSRSGEAPLILADDILGQLDPERQKRFWNALKPDCRIFASGTVRPPPPPEREWKVWKVANGTFLNI